MNSESTVQRFLSKLTGSATAGGLNFLSQILISRLLGPSLFGKYYFIQNHFESLFQTLELGASNSYFSLISQDKKFYGRATGFMILIVLLSLLAVLCYVFLAFTLGIQNLLWPSIYSSEIWSALFLGVAIWLSRTTINISDAAGFSRVVEIARFFKALISVLFVVALSWMGSKSISLILLVSAASYLVFAVFCALYGHIKMGEGQPDFHKEALKDAFDRFKGHWGPLVYYGVFTLFVALFERWLLQYASGSEAQGYFGVSMQIATGIFVITYALTPVIQRESAVAFGKKNYAAVGKLFEKYLNQFFLVAAIPSVYLLFHSREIIQTIFGIVVEKGNSTFLVMALVPIQATTGRLSVGVLFATNRTRTYMKIGMFRDIFGLCLGYYLVAPSTWLVPGLDAGAVGLAIKMLVSQMLNTSMLNWSVCKFLKVPYWVQVRKSAMGLLSLLLLAWISKATYHLPMTNATIPMLILSFCSYTTLIFFCAWFFPGVLGMGPAEACGIKSQIRKLGQGVRDAIGRVGRAETSG